MSQREQFLMDHIKKILERIKTEKRTSVRSIAREYEAAGIANFANVRRWVMSYINKNVPEEERELYLKANQFGTPRKKKSKNKNSSLKESVIEQTVDNTNKWTEDSSGAVWEYQGTESIQTLDQALEFCEVDLKKFEVSKYTFNSWDVTMKIKKVDSKTGLTYEEPVTRTNYQAKVEFAKIKPLLIEKPEYKNIKVNPTQRAQMFVIIGCVHRPFHDKKLWKAFLSFLKKNRGRISGIIVNGDFLDLRSLSKHEEWIPEGIDLAMEYSSGLQGIVDIESALRNDVRKIFIYGNHEDRFFRDKKELRKYGSALQSPHQAMELDQRNWEIITDWKNGFVTLGNDTDVFHGVKVGMNAAKDQLNAIPDRNHIFNHTHRFQTYSNGKFMAVNGGCMIDFDSDMFKYVDRGVRGLWRHGFSVCYVGPKGESYLTPVPVKEKKFFFEGNIYK